MEPLHSPFFTDTTTGGCLPFIIASHGSLQDRVIFGPAEFAEDQNSLFEWLYRDLPRSRIPAFRLGSVLGYAVAARVYAIDFEETISHRRDAVVVVGLAMQKASPSRLCDALGLLIRPIASIAAHEAFPRPQDTEPALLSALAEAVARSDLSFDWSTKAYLALRQCVEVPHYGSWLWRLVPWRLRKRRLFAAILDSQASLPLQFCAASEFWRRSARSDITVAIDDGDGKPGMMKLLYEIRSDFRSPLTILEGREIRIGSAKVTAFAS